MKWSYKEQAADAILDLKAQGYVSCALEITAASVPYNETEYPDKLCLIVGHEDHGVTKRTLAACDMTIYIPDVRQGRFAKRSCVVRGYGVSYPAQWLK